MANAPTTSTTLLKDLASDSQHARWGEFVARYQPMMMSYMREHFPSIEAEEAVQETLISLIRVFPVYHYDPEEKGHFRNYLTGILRHKALALLSKASERDALAAALEQEPRCPPDDDESEYTRWRDAVFEIALSQYLSDDAVTERTKRVFMRLTMDREKPESVARAFGLSRNAVDQIKNRAVTRLRELVRCLESVDDASIYR